LNWRILIHIIAFILFYSLPAFCQPVEWGVGIGAATYFGDLTPYSFRGSRSEFLPAGTLGIRKNFDNGLFYQLNFDFGKIAGDDRKSPDPARKLRNLHFQSKISSLSLMPGWQIGISKRLSIIGSAGIALFHFQPTALLEGKRYLLKSFHTEGQGLPSGPEPYRLIQFALPAAGGFRWTAGDGWSLELQLKFFYSFTDYLDDVSGAYFDPILLKQAYGGLALNLADRHLQESAGAWVPRSPGNPRGNPSQKDHFAIIKLTWWQAIGFVEKKSKHNRKTKCPSIR
jgi:hypothetical protein